MLKGNEKREEKLTYFLDELRKNAQDSIQGGRILAYNDFRSLADLEKAIEDAISKEIRRQLRHTVDTAGTRQEMYLLGARIASSSRERLYVVQKSGILILGARDYNAPSSQRIWYEVEYLNALDNWINSCIGDPTRRCVYLYEVDGTRKEIENYNLKKIAASNLIRYKELERESACRFQIASMTVKHPPGPMTVGDDWYAFWVMGAHDAVTISFSHQLVCNEVVKVLNPLINRGATLENQLHELGLT